MTRRVVLATRNPGKVAELRRILAGLAVELVDLDQAGYVGDVAETGATFVENALLKARTVADSTGLPAVADDSGLEVAALNGMPGVLSARWAGRHGDDAANLRLLLAQVDHVPVDRRDAAFVCAAAASLPDGRSVVSEGRVAGRLTREPRGTGGFGYDPVFVPTGHTLTTAEMGPAEKDAISHRGQAFRRLAAQLPGLLAEPAARAAGADG